MTLPPHTPTACCERMQGYQEFTYQYRGNAGNNFWHIYAIFRLCTQTVPQGLPTTQGCYRLGLPGGTLVIEEIRPSAQIRRLNRKERVDRRLSGVNARASAALRARS